MSELIEVMKGRSSRNSIDSLVVKLGMQVALRPILDSGDGYARVSEAINQCLNIYLAGDNRKNVKWGSGSGWTRRIFENQSCSTNIEYFMEHYGIGCDPKTRAQMARIKKVSVTRVDQRVYVVIGILKYNHQRDIWYNSI